MTADLCSSFGHSITNKGAATIKAIFLLLELTPGIRTG